LKTRRFHALARQEAIDRVAVHTKNASDAHGVESTVMDQAANRFGMDAELRRHLPDADQTCLLSIGG
jgi:hypothetical protein